MDLDLSWISHGSLMELSCGPVSGRVSVFPGSSGLPFFVTCPFCGCYGGCPPWCGRCPLMMNDCCSQHTLPFPSQQICTQWMRTACADPQPPKPSALVWARVVLVDTYTRLWTRALPRLASNRSPSPCPPLPCACSILSQSLHHAQRQTATRPRCTSDRCVSLRRAMLVISRDITRCQLSRVMSRPHSPRGSTLILLLLASSLSPPGLWSL